MKNFNQKLLSASVSMLMTLSICHITVTQASDIDIYKLPDKTKLSIFMMLDTSGSMRGASSCDLPSEISANAYIENILDPSGYYTRGYCQVGGTKKYYYYYRTQSSGRGWYYCGGISDIPTRYNCQPTNTPFQSTLDNYTIENNYYYYNYDGGTQYADRITRLKDALYTLAMSTSIPATTEIGIGSFSTSATIQLPTAQWGNVGSPQRQRALNLLQSLNASGSTSTSLAYGRSARYLLSGYGSYPSPLDKITDPKCSGKGIYFLTDGEPNGGAGSATSEMQTAIGQTSSNWSSRLTGGTASYSDGLTQWEQISSFARDLNTGTVLQRFFNSMQRNNEHTIKTAVVGFGATFDVADPNGRIRQTLIDPSTGSQRTYYNCSLVPLIDGRYVDARNACYWGNKTKFSDGTLVPNIGSPHPTSYGEGGFYSASSTQDVITSFTNFVDDMKPRFDPIATGSPSIPIDALNPIQVQPFGYYAKFTPKPQEKYQLWLGNLNKYHVYKGQLYNADKTIALIQSSGVTKGQLNPDAIGIWGAKGTESQLVLRDTTISGNQSSNRILFTNRQINLTTGAVEEAKSLQKVDLTTLFVGADPNTAKLANDPQKNYWLNALGYLVPEDATGLTINSLANYAENRKLGAVMHSKPILLTQAGKIVVPAIGDNKGQVTTIDRKDYLLFGTNQGMLHVINVDDGKEVFAFVPHEIMKNKAKGFLPEGATTGGRENLFYGVDGPWAAYTQYVSKTDKTLTVGSSGRKDNDGNDLDQKGLQWVYGGLRMGGRSYYALDLTTIDSPSLKFHINPDAAAVNTPLSYMGQSWSKPTIAWVNWGGVRKLVMFVGGGYDSGYEDPAYNQVNKKGAGVYMFDAGNGDLLWWASANVGTAGSSSAATTSGVIAKYDSNLQYSVVSQINAVDRNGDGTVDHLYFGDLAGQAFRIDLNNDKSIAPGAFAKRIVRLYDQHVSTGDSPRFYEMPSFSVHKGLDGLFGVLALSSGNRSSPLAGTHQIDGVNVTTVTANDAVYVIYDNDVARSDLYDDTKIAATPLRTSANNEGVSLPIVSFAQLKDGIPQKASGVYNGGWRYQYSSVKGKYKGMNEIYAFDGMLYVSVYHKDGTGIAGDCGSGVIGDTEVYQFCLPTGKCSFYTNDNNTQPNSVVIGGGILGTGLGQGWNTVDNSLIVKRDPEDCKKTENKNKPECQLFDSGARLQHLRWYESR